MPYGTPQQYRYNEYNNPSFLDAFTEANSQLNGLRQERGLADVERQRVQDISSDSAPITIQGLAAADADQNDDKAYGRYDTAAKIAPGQAVGDVTSSQHTEAYKLGDQTFTSKPTDDQVAQTKARMRASVMRTYGNAKGANDEEQAAQRLANERLSGTRTQQQIDEGVYKLRSAARTDQEDQATADAEEATRNYIKQNQVDPTTPSGAADVAAHHVGELIKAGRMGEAAKASEAFSKQITAQLKASGAQRAEAAAQVQAALQNGGDITPALKQLDSFLPNGGRVVSAVRNRDGSYTINRVEANGQPNTKQVTPQQISQMLDMVTGSDFDKVSQQFVEGRLKQDLTRAQIAQHRQSTGNAVEANEERRYKFKRDRELDEAYATPEDERTGRQNALVSGNAERVTDSRPARTGNNGMTAPKVNPDGSQTIVDRATNTVWTLDRGAKVWRDATPGRAPSERRDPTQAPGGMPAPSASPSPGAAATVPPAQQLVVGKIYTRPGTGEKLKWTGTGFIPAPD